MARRRLLLDSPITHLDLEIQNRIAPRQGLRPRDEQKRLFQDESTQIKVPRLQGNEFFEHVRAQSTPHLFGDLIISRKPISALADPSP
jgi:hypothetical protein